MKYYMAIKVLRANFRAQAAFSCPYFALNITACTAFEEISQNLKMIKQILLLSNLLTLM